MIKLILGLTVLSGCATPMLLRPGDVAPITAQVSGERVATWQRAIVVLLDEGYIPQVLNEAACYISAKQRDDVTTGALAGTTAIVMISPDGVLRVEVGGAGVYNSAADLERDVEAVQNRLVQEIQSRAALPSAPPLAPS